MFVRTIVVVLVAWAGASGPEQPPPDTPDRALAQLRQTIDRGAYEKAERDARALVARLSAEPGPSQVDAARAQGALVEALQRGGRSGDAATLTLAQAVLARTQQRTGRDSLETATALHHLAAITLERGEPTAALRLDERAAAMRSRRLPADAPEIADSADRLAAVFLQLERLDSARLALTRALAIREARAGTEPLALARTLELWCWLLRDAGDYAAAEKPLQRVQRLWQDHAPDHPDRAWTFELEGDLHFLAGKLEPSRTSWTESMQRLERTTDPPHPGIVALHRRLAMASDALGDRRLAQEFVDRALAHAPRLAPCHVERLGLQEYGASRADVDGAYTTARREYRASLELHTTCLGPTHSRTATVLYNLGMLAKQMGDFVEADRLLAAATRVGRRPRPPASLCGARMGCAGGGRRRSR
jgi:tetratricopeptide (TPR) repeat protein